LKIFISHSYGRRLNLPEEECEENVQKSIWYAREVIKLGHNHFVPNLWHFIHSNFDISAVLWYNRVGKKETGGKDE